MTKKLKILKQIDGKFDPITKKEPRTLDEIWGDTGIYKYQTFDEADYTTQLNSLNKTDLQAHAVKIGLIPIDNRNILTQRLLREFKKHVASYRDDKPKIKSKKVSFEAIRIMAEGR